MSKSIFERLGELKLVPVIKIDRPEDALPLGKALCDGGLPCAEVTFRTAAAAESISIISRELPDMLVGAGTVLTLEQLDSAIAAGAKFIVSPGLNPTIVKACIEKGIPVLPGCATPSDIERALELGLTHVKFFPAENIGGLAAIKAMSAPYTSVKFIPTGGISAKNVRDYLAFPKILACGGSWMVSADLIASGNFDAIRKLTAEAVELTSPAAAPAPAAPKGPLNIVKNPGKTPRIVTFGEIMLRLAPEGYTRFVQAEKFGATYGGGEANVAVSLSGFGMDAAFATKLPDHDIGQAAVNSLRRFGVDTSRIVRGGARVGIYFLEKGASQRPSKVIYDRAGSSIATASASDFDWERILDGADWFHFTGITPALGDNVAAICLDALKACRKLGIPVSCDLNYRKNLWSREKAGKVMGGLMEYVSLCIANEEDAGDVFGIKAAGTDITGGKLSHDGYKSVAAQLTERFGFSSVAITLRQSHSANDNTWGAMLYSGGEYFFSKNYDVHIVDRVGGGDSFGAGLIYGTLEGMAPQAALEFAVAASCLKHSIEGDFNLVSVKEVFSLAGGDASGRVQR